MSEELKTVGDRIRYALTNHPSGKKTQNWLKDQLGLSQGLMSQWMSKTNPHKPKNPHRVAEVLGVSVKWLEHGTGDIRASSGDDSGQLLSTVRALLRIQMPDKSPKEIEQIYNDIISAGLTSEEEYMGYIKAKVKE